MKEFYRNYLQSNTFFWVFSGIGVLLIIIAFFIPPTAQIHQSVLYAVAEIDGIIALGAVLKAIDKGTDVSMSHNNTSISITNKEDE